MTSKFGWKPEDIKIEKRGISKAEPNPQLTPQGRQALAVTEALEADIRDKWATLTHNIEKGMPIRTAMAQFKQQMMGLIVSGMSEAWAVGSGSVVGGEAEIDEALAVQEDYLNKFIAELTDSLKKAPNKDAIRKILAGNESRAMLYAGAAWLVFNRAKVFGKPDTALFRWSGPTDSRSCSDCIDEVKMGVRPLKEIKRFPGEVSCIGNCRHEIIQVR